MKIKPMNQNIHVSDNLLKLYPDIYTPESLSTLA